LSSLPADGEEAEPLNGSDACACHAAIIVGAEHRDVLQSVQKPTTDSPGVIVFPPLLAFVTLLIGVWAHFFHSIPISPRLPLRAIGAMFAILAGCFAFAARAEMAKAGTNVNPSLPATAIVTGGPYRFTRNPMYLSLCLLNLGIGLLLCDLIPTILTVGLAAVLHFGVIVREERYLERKFGEVYSTYRGRVRRWL
jgi:protein-S-isoprenylcysteine O-methyltransferase Ste14